MITKTVKIVILLIAVLTEKILLVTRTTMALITTQKNESDDYER